ncbi:MAG: hypothetical protein ACJASW_001278 [Polaribacter sp.]|jgi:hypothetical protein
MVCRQSLDGCPPFQVNIGVREGKVTFLPTILPTTFVWIVVDGSGFPWIEFRI